MNFHYVMQSRYCAFVAIHYSQCGVIVKLLHNLFRHYWKSLFTNLLRQGIQAVTPWYNIVVNFCSVLFGFNPFGKFLNADLRRSRECGAER